MSDVESTAASPGDRKVDWFRQAKLGMFIHWGLYSQAAGSWKGRRCYGIAEYLQQTFRIPNAEYAQLAAEFNPTAFDARAWARFAKAAGFRYIVITAKHHDGFAMYKSDADGFNIVDATEFGRDPLAELAQAARDEGLAFGFYYSQYLDWRDPDAGGNDWDFPSGPRDFQAYVERKAKPQIEELLTRYGPIGVVWFDIPGASTPEESRAWADLVRRLQPDCLISGRVGNGQGDFENFGDNEIPPRGPREKPWESLFTHNHSWGFVEHDKTFKSAGQLIRMVSEVAARGGNTIINVGPEPSGRIPDATVQAFSAMGAWLQVNGESIYGTHASPLHPMPWGVVTARPGKLYLHIHERPSQGRLLAHGAGELEPTGVRLLDGGNALRWEREGPDLWVEIPGELKQAASVVIVVDTTQAPAPPQRLVHLLSTSYKGLSLDVATAELSAALKIRRQSGWGYFGHTNYFSTYEGQCRAGDTVTWMLRALEPGPYWLSLEYAASRSQAGREGLIEVGDQRLPFEVLESGEIDPYRPTPLLRQDLGVVHVQPGLQQVSLQPALVARGSYRSIKRPTDADGELFTFRRLHISPHQ